MGIGDRGDHLMINDLKPILRKYFDKGINIEVSSHSQ